jgi:flagellar hook-length control protein FliK
MITLPALAAIPARPATQAEAAPDTASDNDASAGGGFAAALEHARGPEKAPTDGKTRADAKAPADTKARAETKGSANPGRGADPKTDTAPEAPAEAVGEAAAVSDDSSEAIDPLAPDLTALLPGWAPALAAQALTSAPMATATSAVLATPATEADAGRSITVAPYLPGQMAVQSADARGARRLPVPDTDTRSSDASIPATETREAPTANLTSGPMAVPNPPLAASKSVPTNNDPALTTMLAAKAATDSTLQAAPPLPNAAMSTGLPALQATPNFSLHSLATTAPPFEARLAATIDSPTFAPALAHQITWLAGEGVQHARLTLNPVEMGPLAVKIALDGTQARIDFSADMPATRAAIEASLPTLAAALNDSGLTLAGGGVFDGQARRGTPDPRHAQPASPSESGDRVDADAGARASTTVRASRGLVDLVA